MISSACVCARMEQTIACSLCMLLFTQELHYVSDGGSITFES